MAQGLLGGCLTRWTMKTTVLYVPVNTTSYADATNSVIKWASARQSRYTCVANVHMLMEAFDSPVFRQIVASADLVTPDGMPLVWMMRMKGVQNQQRVYGPTLMLCILEAAAREGIPIGFYGGKPHVLDSLTWRMQMQYPNLNVAYSFSPPFRAATPAEDESTVDEINESGARILFVGLGCPKQEIWMAGHRGKVKAVMLGVGAAFDFHAGILLQAPALMQKLGLEWLFRFFSEPRRLWRRYLFHNPRFLVVATADLLGLLKE